MCAVLKWVKCCPQKEKVSLWFIRDKDMEGIKGNQITATSMRASGNKSDGHQEDGDQQ